MKEKFKEKLKFSNEAERRKTIQACLFICFFIFLLKKIISLKRQKAGKENDDKK
jgi:hypothetical protein